MQLGGGKYRHRGIAVTGASSSPCRAKEIQSAFKTATRDRSGLAVGRVECCGCGGPRPRAATSRAARMVKALRRTGRASSARMGPSGTGRAPCQLNRNQWRARREPRPERSNPRPDSPATKPHPPPASLPLPASHRWRVGASLGLSAVVRHTCGARERYNGRNARARLGFLPAGGRCTVSAGVRVHGPVNKSRV